MKQILFLLSILFFYSCADEKKEESLSRNCSLSISLYGAPWEDQFNAMFNVADKFGDSLIVSKRSKINDSDTIFYKKIILNQAEQDTLYGFFEQINRNFKLTDKQSDIVDGTKVRISISGSTNALTYVYSGLKDASNADPEIGKLVKFINIRLPEAFQMF